VFLVLTTLSWVWMPHFALARIVSKPVDLETVSLKVLQEILWVHKFKQWAVLDFMLLNRAGRQVKMKATMLAICVMCQALFVLSDLQLTCLTGWFGFLARAPLSAMLVPELFSLHAVA
jgi:hypothetical protein